MTSSPRARSQRTLAHPVTIRGLGLHLGRKVTLEARPAPADSGIVFVRTDLDGAPRVRACLASLHVQPRRTVLRDGAAEVHTVEHLLATFWALGIQAAEVHIDGPELPGLDGSAIGFYRAIAEAGTVDLGAPARVLEIREPVIRSAANGASLVALPDGSGLRVSYTLEYPGTSLPAQHLSLVIDEESFASEIAPARTFCLEEEVLALRAKGLGRGANTQNTLVIGRSGQILENRLRFADEFVRHKILDLLGDLYLCESRIAGHVVAVRSGHELNVELARGIVASQTTPPATSPVPKPVEPVVEVSKPVPRIESDTNGLDPRWVNVGAKRSASGQPYGYLGPLDTVMIQELLPHTYPFLLIDRVLEVAPDGQRLRALKNVTFNEPYFPGHFPGEPVMPGVLQVEAMAQAGGVLLLHHEMYAGRRAYLLSVDRVKFRRRIVPGDQLIFEVDSKVLKQRSARVDARALVDGKLVAEAQIQFVLANE